MRSLRPLRILNLVILGAGLALPLVMLGKSASQDPPTQLPGRNTLVLGTAWYPEQWPESRWETDLRMMAGALIYVVRVAEFAWSTMAPSEGHFESAWLDHAIRLARKHHIAV